ncbi:hypothetical protein [Nonomuraea sp. B1E8]|uniref:hypothetical protein n=1 Tax=unclassified Nonomuraea TaxID=2593643 RepID=UPI00325CC15A
MGIMAAAATVAVLGGALIAVRNVGTQPPVAMPPDPGGKVGAPATQPTTDPTLGPTASPPTASPQDTAQASPSSTVTSTFPPLQDVPEVCDLLPASLTSRLAPKSESEPGVAKDGYGAKRKDCAWNQKGYNMKGGYNESRSFTVKVNVFPDNDSALDDADFSWRSMRDDSGQTKGAPYNTKYGEIKEINDLGDGAYAIYNEHTDRRRAMAWILVVRGNATIDIRFHGSDNKGREILPNKDSRPVPEEELLRGAEEIAREALKNLTG